MTDLIKLRTDSLLHANFSVLQEDFTFIVNGEEFRTNKFIASLLSPVVSNLFTTNQSKNSVTIDTNSRGNFKILLNVVSCHEQVINDNDKEFLCEILEKLQNKYLKIELNSKTSEITYENVFSDFEYQIRYPHYYQEIISKKISIIAENLYQILSKEEERQKLSKLDLEIIERIVAHENLVIDTEDQLLEFINSLYSTNRKFSTLYQYVHLLYCSTENLHTFLTQFRIEDINQQIWDEIKNRLEHSISKPIVSSIAKRNNYEAIPKGPDDFDGIINTLRKRANNNDIKTEIELTAYQEHSSDYCAYNSIQYDSTRYFHSKNEPNSWMCFEFKNHLIIPTHYTIRTYSGDGYQPIHHKVEVSNDKNHWEVIHEENGYVFPSGSRVTSLFSIAENKQREAKFIRITQTGPNSSNDHYFIIDSIEFYGYLK